MQLLRQSLLIGWLLFFPLGVYAYIGPGMGLGAVGVVLGILGAIVLALFAILWYPFKRLWNHLGEKKEKEKPVDSENDAED